MREATHDKPVFPQKTVGGDSVKGLTVREYFAGKALQGLLANPTQFGWRDREDDEQQFTEAAVAYADWLIHALNSSKELK